MITPSFGLTATERVLPRMALDFTTAILDPRVTFTRSGNTATVVNSSGNVVLINADLPRFDFDPLTLVCKGLLVEESRINLFQYSEDFSNAFWIKSGMLAFGSGSTVDAITSPDGTVNADLLTEDTSAGGHIISTNLLFNFISGTSYTQSYFVKANGRTKFQTSYRSNWFGTTAINFDLVAKTATVGAGSSAATSGTITEFKNGWFRLTHTATATATGSSPSDTFFSFADATGSTSYTGDGTSGAYVWGAQLEVGAFATSYIPNLLNSTTTRNADVATMTGTNFSDWFNASEGTFEIDFNPYFVGGAGFSQTILGISDGTANNAMDIYKRSNVDTSTRLNVADVGVNQVFINAGVLTTGNNKVAMAYKLNSYAFCKNASTVVIDDTATVPVVNKLAIGIDSQTSTFSLAGHVQRLKYWPQRLINAEVQAFSK
jgi:hypothetical protein